METTVKTDLKEKVCKASVRYLERRGYEILDAHPNFEDIDLVAKDDDTVVFAKVFYRTGSEKGFVESEPNHNKMEISAALWLSESEEKDMVCRFDHISVLVLSPQRAFLRHHLNVMGVSKD